MDATALRLVVAGIAWGLASAGHGEVVVPTTDPGSGIKVSVEGWAGLRAAAIGRDTGLLPVSCTIVNGSPAAHVWTIGLSQGSGMSAGVTPTARLSVPAGATGTATLFVRTGADGFQILQIAGHGVSERLPLAVGTTLMPGGGKVLTAGISRQVQAAQGNPFARYELVGGPLDMALAPDDWRGWSAFRQVLLTEGEWQELAGGRRKALLDWALTGGRAGVLVADRSADRLARLGLPAAGADGRRLVGAGEIVVVPWDGTKLEEAQVVAFLSGRATLESLVNGYGAATGRAFGASPSRTAMPGRDWERGFGRLVATFGPRTLPVVPILVFLAVLGVVAGPLNVMVLARNGRRSWIFWTTPAISLAAAACLIALMLLQDGVGGVGARRVLALLAPDHNALGIVQEQFSRTGVLLGSSFPIAEPAWVEPLGPQRFGAVYLEADGRTRQGDWFRSRSDQAFLATAVRPSRARIELVAGTDTVPPAVISSIEVPLERVFVIDTEGGYWSADDVGTGERKPLEASSAEAYAEWFASLEADAGPVRRNALLAVRNLRGHAYATSRQSGRLPVATLGAIRWVDERVDFAGPYARSAPP